MYVYKDHASTHTHTLYLAKHYIIHVHAQVRGAVKYSTIVHVHILNNEHYTCIELKCENESKEHGNQTSSSQLSLWRDAIQVRVTTEMLAEVGIIV